MITPQSLRLQIAALVLTALPLGVLPALAEDCDGRYFATDDHAHDIPLNSPEKTLAATLRKARAGVAQEQRNLAISYEIGFRLSRCDEQAAYWYGQAARAGDEIAKRWLRNSQAHASLSAGPECANGGCRDTISKENRVAILYSNARKGDHYFAPVTINGKTAEGLIDTGATVVAMSAELAKMFGIDASKGRAGSAYTANGKMAATYLVLPLIEIAGIEMRNVPISIGVSDGILIGMSFLRRLNVSMSAGTLTMTPRLR